MAKNKISPSFFCLLTVLIFSITQAGHAQQTGNTNFFAADNSHIQYTGRINFANPREPQIWAPGAYMKVRFSGSSLKLIVKNPDKKNLNYLEIVVDGQNPHRIKLSAGSDTVTVAKNLSDSTAHTAMITKDTEAISPIEIEGFEAAQLLSLPAKPHRKIQFIGDSITCGFGNDTTREPCSKGDWHEHENAYMDYGPVAARRLNAQWTLASVSGIGMIHSCCHMKITMPQVYGTIDMRDDSIPYHFNDTPPDVVAICLGQNDGIQDSTAFCSAYVKFIETVREHYPEANIVCLSSPMADSKLDKVLRNYLTGIVDALHKRGDRKVSKYFFSRRYNNGCYGHPSMKQDKLMAAEVSAYLMGLMHW